MELYKDLSNLKISSTLFRDVKFCIAGNISDWIIKLLTGGGAKQEWHITDFMTHLITGDNADDLTIEEVKDIYEKPVVTQQWVIFSAKCGKKLPTNGFKPEKTQLFSGVAASISKICSEDAHTIWGLVNFYGGQCTLDFDQSCTHLIVGKPENSLKYQRAIKKMVMIVTPDWITDSISMNERQDESLYHPRLLNLSNEKTPTNRYHHNYQPLLVKELTTLEEEPEIFASVDSRSPMFDNSNVQELLPSPSKAQDQHKSLFASLTFSDDDEDDNDDDVVNSDGNSLLDQLKNSQSCKESPSHLSSLITPKDEPPFFSPKNEPALSIGCIKLGVSDMKTCESLNVSSPEISSSSLNNLAISTAVSSFISNFNPIEVFEETPSEVKLQTSNNDFTTSFVQQTSIPISTTARTSDGSEVTIVTRRPQLDLINPPVTSLQQNIATPLMIQNIVTPISNITRSGGIKLPSRSLSSENQISRILSQITSQPVNAQHSEVVSSLQISQSSVHQISSTASIPINTLSQNKFSQLAMPSMLCSQPNSLSQAPQSISSCPSPKGLSAIEAIAMDLAASAPATDNVPQSMSHSQNIIGMSRQNPINLPRISSVQTPMQGQIQIHQAQLPVGVRSTIPTQVIQQGTQIVGGPVLQQGCMNLISNQTVSGTTLTRGHLPAGIRQVVPVTHIPGVATSAQQQVHSVGIPGAVVRLPSGVTTQRLQMMTNEDRQNFLEQLRQKQMFEAQQRGKPRQGKPVHQVQYKTVTQGAIHYANDSQNSTGKPGSQIGQATPNWQQSSLVQTRVQPGMQQIITQTPISGATQIITQTPATISNWIPAQQQQTQSQQQFGTSQGIQNRVMVAQTPGWQMQSQAGAQPVAVSTVSSGIVANQVAQVGTNPTGVLTHQQHQLQLHAQQLRQHFPHLTQQEAQQLIQTIPTHLREIQARDNVGRNEYLSQLEPHERQVVNHFYVRRFQQQMLQRQHQLQQQQHLKITGQQPQPQQSPTSWQSQQQQTATTGVGQFPAVSLHPRTLPGRPLHQGLSPQGYVASVPVSPSQASPHMVSPLASPIQREVVGLAGHNLQNSAVAQNLANQNLVNPKTKTALANLLTNRLSGVHPGGLIGQAELPVGTHIVQKTSIPPDAVQAVGPGGEQVLVYQRRTLSNITGNVTNNIIRPQIAGSNQVIAAPATPGYTRVVQPAQQTIVGQPNPHYQRPHLFGHDINTMLPRELCMVGCIFYIADYYADLTMSTIDKIINMIEQHGGEVVRLYDSARVTHVLCKHQKSPVFKQAVRENKRCITICWVNDILTRGKMAPPWQAIHLPTPFGTQDLPMKSLIVSVTGFENEERTAIKLMLQLAGATYTGYFSKQNHLLVCKKFEGIKVSKAKEWKRPVVNGAWLSEVLLGQNTPPLIYQGVKYQHLLDDPLRIDPSLASHLFNAWKFPISVSKESVDKAKTVRETALRKRRSESDGEAHEPKRIRLDPLPHSLSSLDPPLYGTITETETRKILEGPLATLNKESSAEIPSPKVLMSCMKDKGDLERKALELGASLAKTNAEATHLVMGSEGAAPRTVKLMCALSCCRFILSHRWLIDSYAQKHLLPEESYMLQMPEYEKLFGFNLKQTLGKPNRKMFLKEKIFYLTPSVIPGRKWLREIIECAGGTVDLKRKPLSDIREVNKINRIYITITTNTDTHLINDLIKENMPVHNSEFILASIMKQHMDFSLGEFGIEMDREE